MSEALNGTDVEAIKTATEHLLTVSQSFSQKLYEAASQASSDGQTSTGGGDTSTQNDDEIVDAEIVDEQ